MGRPLVWIAGDLDDPSLVPAARWLRDSADTIDACSDPSHGAGPAPSAVVLFQSRPGRWPPQQIELLKRRTPHARFIALMGSWCDGELRSNRPAPELVRIYWHQWRERLPDELAQGGSRHARNQPDVHELVSHLPPRNALRSSLGLVAIATTSRESFAALEDACHAAGYWAAWQAPESPPRPGADVLLIDGWESCPREAPSRSVLLLDWPRPEDLDRAARQGIHRVLGKPLLLSDLFATFAHLQARPESTAAQPWAA